MNKKFFNKKKNKFYDINLYTFFILIFILFILISFFYNRYYILDKSIILIQNYSDKFDYNLLYIEVNKLDHIDDKNIFKYFEEYKNISIFLLPIQKITNQLNNINWISKVNINSNYKNLVSIVIEEEIPLGIYYNGNKKTLFSKNLKTLEILTDNSNFQKLIKFYGEDSIGQSLKLIQNLDINILNLIESAIYIEKRRWNLQLKNDILLKLSENNINNSLKNFMKINDKLSEGDLKNIEIIDLRIMNKAIIRYKNLLND